jgi:hypothetical protein
LARLPGAEIETMPGSKKKKAKRHTQAKSAPKRTATEKSRKKSTKPAKQSTSAKKVAAKKQVMARKLPRSAPPRVPPKAAPRAFAEKVRGFEAGTGIWFVVAGSVEHAVIQGRGSDGAVVIVTDAGVTEVVASGNIFETADQARAARYR